MILLYTIKSGIDKHIDNIKCVLETFMPCDSNFSCEKLDDLLKSTEGGSWRDSDKLFKVLSKMFYRVSVLGFVTVFLTACDNIQNVNNNTDNSIFKIICNERVSLIHAAITSDVNLLLNDEKNEEKYLQKLSDSMHSLEYWNQNDSRYSKFIQNIAEGKTSEYSQQFNTMFNDVLKIYNNKVWQLRESDVYKAKEDLQKYCDKFITSQYTKKILKLFKLDSSNLRPVNVYLSPVTDVSSGIGFYIGNDNILVSLMPCSLVEHAEIIVHEYFHIMFKNMTASLKEEMKDFFKKHNSYAVYNLMNETLAVAGGNILTRLIFANEDEKNPFFIDFVTDFARGIAPMLKSYMEQNRTLDEPFFQNSINVLKKLFPDFKDDIKYHMLSVDIFSSSTYDFMYRHFVKSICSNFFCTSIEFFPLKNMTTRQKVSSNTSIILLKKNENIKGITINNSEMLIKHDKTGLLKIIIKTEDLKMIEKALGLLKRIKISSDCCVKLN